VATETTFLDKEQIMVKQTTKTAKQMAKQTRRLTEEATEQTSRFAEQVSRFPFVQPFAELSGVWWRGTQQMAAWSIETNEKTTYGLIEFQEQATQWAEQTPLASLFEVRRTLARQWMEGSAELARRLWQLEKRKEASQKSAKR
jgi:hypothetical protein